MLCYDNLKLRTKLLLEECFWKLFDAIYEYNIDAFWKFYASLDERRHHNALEAKACSLAYTLFGAWCWAYLARKTYLASATETLHKRSVEV